MQTLQTFTILFTFLSFLFGTPKIVFDHTEHDFGRINEGIDAKHDFTFTNEGDGKLIIQKIEAG